MEVGDRVRVTRNYFKFVMFMPPRGKMGTVTAITPRFIDVRLDEPAGGIQDYLFRPNEVEIVR